MKKKILTIVGARPQFIKCAPVSKELRKFFTEIIVHTGQHYDQQMSDIFFNQMMIPKPDYNLNIGSASHGSQTGHMLIELEKVILHEKPSAVLIYGDTNSTLAGAIVAAKLHIPLIHIEAGLRSFNKTMPEELNRVCADHFSDILFCPTVQAVVNLKHEGVTKKVYSVGDVMKDAARLFYPSNDTTVLRLHGVQKKKSYIFLTIHRQENTDSKERLTNIFNCFRGIEKQVLFPVHPRTRKYIDAFGIELPKNIKEIAPIGYQESLVLQKNAYCVCTDSGGVQKEAFILGTPCITFRKETEWVETVKAGANYIVDDNSKKFIKAYKSLSIHKTLVSTAKFYGDGKSSQKISKILRSILV